MTPSLPRTALLTFLFGALIGLLEALGVLTLLGLGFANPGLEMLWTAAQYGGLALVLLPVGWLCAWILRLPRQHPHELAAWTALGLGWLIANWWMQGEVFRNQSMLGLLPMLTALGLTVLVFVLHTLLRVQVARAPLRARRSLLAAFVLLPLVSQFAFRQVTHPNEVPADAGALPDVTVVVIDTLRADHLGTYGYQREDGEQTSPVIDAFAETGVVFEHTWSQAPWTRPSMAALHSGLFCSGHTVNQVYDMLPPGATTLAEMANARGYRTGGFSANANVGVTYGFGQGFETLEVVGKPRTLTSFTRWGELQHYVVNKVLNGFLYDGDDFAARVNEQTFAWLDKVAEDSRPKFTYVHYIDPHTPYQPPEDGWLFQGERSDLRPMGPFIEQRGTGVHEYPFGAFPDPGPELRDRVIRMYDAEIAYVDREFGKLLDGLRQRGLLDPEDWLILTSDHGEEFYEHGRWGHGQSLFEEQLHVPLIVFGPQVTAGARQPEPVNLLDVHQTVAEIVGFAWPDGKQESMSLSLLPLMNGAPDDAHARLLYAERLQNNIELRAARQDFLKILELPDWERSSAEGREHLYMQFDLAANPDEITGLVLQDLLDKKPLPRGNPVFDAGSEGVTLLEHGKALALIHRLERVDATQSAAAKKALQEMGYLDEDGNPIHGIGN